jgi:hypothetical protein
LSPIFCRRRNFSGGDGAAILMIDLLVKDSRRTVTFALTQLALIGCAAIQFATSTGEITYTFSNMFVDDLMSDLLKLFLYMTVHRDVLLAWLHH